MSSGVLLLLYYPRGVMRYFFPDATGAGTGSGPCPAGLTQVTPCGVRAAWVPRELDGLDELDELGTLDGSAGPAANEVTS